MVTVAGRVAATTLTGDGSGLTGISGAGGGDSTETYTNILRSNDSTAIQVADNLIPTENDTFSLGTADKKWSAVHVAGGTIFLGNLTRKLELSNNATYENIQKLEEQLKINKIEYAFYNNSNYLKKLYSIYFPYEEIFLEKKIVNIKNISNIQDNEIILINLISE